MTRDPNPGPRTPSRVFHRTPRWPLPVAVGGTGIELIDAEGKRYIDASGGAAVSCLGHGHPRVIEAIKRQADALAYAHTSFFLAPPFITDAAAVGTIVDRLALAIEVALAG